MKEMDRNEEKLREREKKFFLGLNLNVIETNIEIPF